MKKGAKRIADYFGPRLDVIIVGLLCAFYFVMHFCADESFIAKILPPFPPLYYLGLLLIAFLFQMIVWNLFKLFRTGWYKSITAWLLMLSELMAIMFVFGLASWLLFGVVSFIEFISKGG